MSADPFVVDPRLSEKPLTTYRPVRERTSNSEDERRRKADELPRSGWAVLH